MKYDLATWVGQWKPIETMVSTVMVKTAIEEEHVKENTWMILEMEDQWPNDMDQDT